MNRKLSLFPALIMAGFVMTASADQDWPQWRGPNRDGHAAQQSLLQSWPADGPQLKWQAKNLGEGYSSVSVVGNDLYTLGARNGKCVALCIDASNGSEKWATEISVAGSGDNYNVGWGAGPRSTPTVDGDRIFVLSDVGTIAAINRADGSVLWKRDLVGEFGGKVPFWGYSESPLIDGNRVVVTPGGKNFMVALQISTGKQIWQSKGYESEAQYVSVIKLQVDGKWAYVTAAKPGLVAIDPESGEVLFRDPNTGNGVAVIPTPIVSGNLLYHTSAYGAGNTLLELAIQGGKLSAESKYHLSGKTMENHHGGVVLHEGTIYGFTKANGGQWMAQDLEDGTTIWEHRARPNKSGSICFADGRLYCYNDKDGSVLLIEPKGKEFEIVGKLTLPQQTKIPRKRGAIWAHPVIANQTLFIRDHDLMFAYDVKR